VEPVPSRALRRISDREGAITLDDHLGGEVAVGVSALILQLLGGRGGLVGAAGLLLLLGVLAVALGKGERDEEACRALGDRLAIHVAPMEREGRLLARPGLAKAGSIGSALARLHG